MFEFLKIIPWELETNSCNIESGNVSQFLLDGRFHLSNYTFKNAKASFALGLRYTTMLL